MKNVRENRMKKLLAVLLVLSMLCALMPVFAASFTDISGHWAEGAINAMAEAGAVDGYPDGTFRPDEPVTRAEFAKIITELYGFDTTDSGWLFFPDGEKDAWYGPYMPAYKVLVDWQLFKACSEYGYPEGWSEDTFKYFDAEKPLTRIEAAQAIRFVVGIGDGSFDDELAALAASNADGGDYADNRGISVLIGAVMYLELMNGDGDGRFRPFDPITRAEVCTVLERARRDHGRSNVNEYITVAVYMADQEAGKTPEQIAAEEEERIIARFEKMAASEGFLSEEKKTDADREIVAAFGGVEFSRADYDLLSWLYHWLYSGLFEEHLEQNGIDGWEIEMYGGIFNNSGDYAGLAFDEAAARAVVDEMKRMAAAEIKFDEFGLDRRTAFANGYNAYYFSDLGSDGEDAERLKLHGGTDYAIERLLYFEAVEDMLCDFMTEPGGQCYPDTTEDMRRYCFKTCHVLALADGADDAEAKARAEAVIARLDAGEDMSAIIDGCGGEPSMEVTRCDVFTEGDMIDELYQEAKALGPGQYSKEPVKTKYGYFVVCRLPIVGDEPELEWLRGRVARKMFDDFMELCVEKFEDNPR